MTLLVEGGVAKIDFVVPAPHRQPPEVVGGDAGGEGEDDVLGAVEPAQDGDALVQVVEVVARERVRQHVVPCQRHIYF